MSKLSISAARLSRNLGANRWKQRKRCAEVFAARDVPAKDRLSLIMTRIVLAQSEAATLSGTVTDTTGAILHNVSLMLPIRERTFRSQQRGTIPAVSCSQPQTRCL
jgi:hypothetical protein